MTQSLIIRFLFSRLFFSSLSAVFFSLFARKPCASSPPSFDAAFEYLQRAMGHTFCLVVFGDFAGTPKIAEIKMPCA